jgi:hypothetical protein
MDERILINPDNRFLASSGANDFSLYGAPAEPTLSFRPAKPDGRPDDSVAPPAAGAANAGDEPLPTDLQHSAVSAAEAAGPAWGSSAVAARAADASPRGEAAPAADSPGATSTLVPTAFDLTAPLAPPAAAAPPAAPAQAPQPLQTAQAEPVEPLAAAVSGPLASLLIDEAVGAAADDVQDLLGADPVAGIATLVSLVSISDVVDLGDAGAAAVSDIVGTPADTMLDALAADPLGALAPDPEEVSDDAPAAGLLGGSPLPDDAGDLPLGLG